MIKLMVFSQVQYSILNIKKQNFLGTELKNLSRLLCGHTSNSLGTELKTSKLIGDRA